MNRFYDQPIWLQWIETSILLLLGMYPAVLIMQAIFVQPAYYLLIIFYGPWMQFTMSPLFKLLGTYKYYSPMLLGFNPNDTHIDLHSGTSFDYLFVMLKYKAGIKFRNRILLYHLEGLLNIIQEIEEKKIPETVIISGTSYFFNERTMLKFGFEKEKPLLSYKFNLLMNAVDLFWMYSLAQGRLSIPKIWKVQKATVQGQKLVENKVIIANLYQKLQGKYQ